MEYSYIRKRITELRIKKGVSEYQMSLDLGHSRSYIQNIVSGRSKPSIDEFLYICDYLGSTPQDFFDERLADPAIIQNVLDGLRSLSEKDLLFVLNLIDRLSENTQNESTHSRVK